MDTVFWWYTSIRVYGRLCQCYEFEKFLAFKYTGIRVYERLFLKKWTLFFGGIQVYGYTVDFAIATSLRNSDLSSIPVYGYTSIRKAFSEKMDTLFFGGIQVYGYTVDFAFAMSLENS